MKELKKLGYFSTAVVFGIFGFVATLLTMIILKITFSVDPSVAAQFGIDVSQLTLTSGLSVVVLAGFSYFVTGLVMALLYNLIARYFIGVRFELGDVKVRVAKTKKKK